MVLRNVYHFLGTEKEEDEFLENINATNKEYITVIKNLNRDSLKAGTLWLLSIVEETRNTVLKHLPSFN